MIAAAGLVGGHTSTDGIKVGGGDARGRRLFGSRRRAPPAPRPAGRDGGARDRAGRTPPARSRGGPGRRGGRHEHRGRSPRRIGGVHAGRPRRGEAGGRARARRRRGRSSSTPTTRRWWRRPRGVSCPVAWYSLDAKHPDGARRGRGGRLDRHPRRRPGHARDGRRRARRHLGGQDSDHGRGCGALQRVERPGRRAGRIDPRARRHSHRHGARRADQQSDRESRPAQRLRVRLGPRLRGLRAQPARADRPDGDGARPPGRAAPRGDRPGRRPRRPRHPRAGAHGVGRGARPRAGEGDARRTCAAAPPAR